jgi:hypothetical protein
MEKRRIKMGFREEGEPQNKGKNEICKHGSSGEKRRQIRSRAVVVPYFVENRDYKFDWMRRTKTMGSHFNVMGLRSVYVLEVSAVGFPLIQNPL